MTMSFFYVTFIRSVFLVINTFTFQLSEKLNVAGCHAT